MALFNKIFSTSKKKNISSSGLNANTISPFPFSIDQVRVVLFRECDWRGTKLLFDSEAFVKFQQNTTGKSSSSSKSSHQQRKNGETTKDQFQTTIGHVYELNDGVTYKYCRPVHQTDANSQLSEMIFGSVALAFRGTTFKVHWLENPPRIMCSQVFLAPVQNATAIHHTPRSSQECSGSDSLDASSLNSISLSLCVRDDLSPEAEDSQCSTGDSGYSGDPWHPSGSSRVSRSSLGSLFSDFDSGTGRKNSVDSMEGGCGSMQRRISRHLSTSLENRLASADSIGQLGETHWTGTYASELSVPKLRRNSEIMEKQVPDVRKRNAVSGDALVGSRKSSTRRPRLGIAVCFTLNPQLEKEMKLFCSEHMMMLEGMVNRIRAAVEDAYISRHRFLHIMLNAWYAAANWLMDLFTAPRISSPVWLSLSTGYIKNSNTLANQFMKDLNVLMTQTDTKDTNFFLSRLLTGVLSCHLAWVNTVAPILATTTAMDREDSDASLETLVNEERHKLSEISKHHPYNALWAQLGDLYGAIGTPLRVAKTVLSGTDQRMIERLLNVLTYFIRCGEIKRHRLFNQFDRNVVKTAITQSKRISKQLSSSVKKPTVVVATVAAATAAKPPTPGMKRTATTTTNLSGLVTKNISNLAKLNIPEVSEEEEYAGSRTDEVVFMLGGDNEELKIGGIKEAPSTSKPDCCTRGHKKHSGVKFNFEQYPQIATTYMKNKNLELNNYEFMEKTHKMELQWKLNYDLPSTSKGYEHCKEEEKECECCRSVNLQTPSNASELEFTTEDLNACHEKKEPPKIVISDPGGSRNFQLLEEREIVDVVELPFQNDPVGDEPKSSKLLPGFMPSLFVGISNHFISDMVLQGIITEQNKWEDALRHDLMLSARCSSLDQTPTENVAIVANVDKWDVRMLSSMSSQSMSTSISQTSKTFGLVGMSQLVSTLLETVQTMWIAGASSFQCMSFIEAKLQEIYLQSETLASFLLATEFCSLNMLTTALELTDNDIPLLLAVTSIHSPQVTKKYGISSR